MTLFWHMCTSRHKRNGTWLSEHCRLLADRSEGQIQTWCRRCDLQIDLGRSSIRWARLLWHLHLCQDKLATAVLLKKSSQCWPPSSTFGEIVWTILAKSGLHLMVVEVCLGSEKWKTWPKNAKRRLRKNEGGWLKVWNLERIGLRWSHRMPCRVPISSKMHTWRASTRCRWRFDS